jgi:hypothetical protein
MKGGSINKEMAKRVKRKEIFNLKLGGCQLGLKS